jgi:hypothetical protein
LGAKRVMNPGPRGLSSFSAVWMLFCPGAIAIGPYS